MIQLDQLHVQAGDFWLRDVTLQVAAGSHSCLVGNNGTGKTTLLETICGLRTVSRGHIFLQGNDVTSWMPNQRGIGYVPQDLALFPTMTVAQQLAFALRFNGSTASDVRYRVHELATWLQLKPLLSRYPQRLSGGEKQRVALGRAIASKPRVLLLDEPFSALDRQTRDEMLCRVEELKTDGLTILHVTHDDAEVERLADQVVRLEQGRLTVVTSNV